MPKKKIVKGKKVIRKRMRVSRESPHPPQRTLLVDIGIDIVLLDTFKQPRHATCMASINLWALQDAQTIVLSRLRFSRFRLPAARDLVQADVTW